MDAQEIKESLTPEQIIQIFQALGEEIYRQDNYGNLIFKTICHGGNSYKLYYYLETKQFHCFTDCSDSFDIFELIQRVKNCTFIDSISYVCKLFGIQQSKRKGFINSKNLIDDWEIINRYINYKQESIHIEINKFNHNILNLFKEFYHKDWLNDGINIESMIKYQIQFDITRNKIIIPHFNDVGELIGIRGRSLNQDEVEAGKKYMPLYIENTEYRHPLGYNLYALNNNKEAIQRIKKIAIFESEKSCLQCDSMFGKDNFTVAVCGSSITNWHLKKILDLGVREVFLCFDRQYENNDTEEAYKYAEKLRYLASKFANYCTTYVLWDDLNLLDYKDSPSDKGKKVLLELMKNKYEVTTKTEE